MIKRIDYLRVSLTNSCNLNCFYCRPNDNINYQSKSGNFDKFTSSIKVLHTLGVKKIRFTGGEPTLYKKLPELIKYVKKIDSSIVTAMTTNAVLMNQKAKELSEAGLDSVNISIDTLNRNKFNKITGRDNFESVVNGIKSSINHIPKVKLNVVLIRNINDEEVVKLIKFANNLNIDIRFIEYMPTKTKSHNRNEYISGDEIMTQLPFKLVKENSEKSSAAEYYTSSDLNIRVGFINPVSHSFCANCNRIRLTSEGDLYGCLFSGMSINLFDCLKEGIEHTSNQINKLIQTKTYAGCVIQDDKISNLPSFINIGG